MTLKYLMWKEEEKDTSSYILGKLFIICIITMFFNYTNYSQTLLTKTHPRVLTLKVSTKEPERK